MFRSLRSLRTIRNIPRLKDIALVLVRHGLHQTATFLGAPLRLRLRRFWPTTKEPLRQVERLRLAFQELGPTFIKLGQVIANRPDLFSEEYVTEFTKLEDRVDPVPYPEIHAMLARELGGDPLRFFRHIEETPLASASIAQIHRATTLAGEEVVLKVLKPGVEAIIQSDLQILSIFAEALARGEQFEVIDAEGLVGEVRRALLRELNFTFERNALERVRGNFKNDAGLVVPKTYPELSSKRLLVMEYLDGVSLRRQTLTPEQAAGIARECARILFEMIFRDGYFHADPHASNILLLKDGRLGWVDFGSMGLITEGMRAQLFTLLRALIARDYTRMARVILKLGRPRGTRSQFEFTQDLASRLDPYFGLTFRELEIASLFKSILELARDHRLTLAPGFALLTRCLVLMEGVAQRLDPDFNAMLELEPIIRRELFARYRPDRFLGDAVDRLLAGAENMLEFPGQIGEILRRAAQGHFRVETDLKGLEQLTSRFESSNTRVVQAIIVAALLVSSSLVMQKTEMGPELWGLPLIGLVGYVVAGLMGVWVVLSLVGRR